jgi:aspartate 1-decarboxylase
MQVMLKSKISGIKITRTTTKCDGSISMPRELMNKAYIAEYEQVHVLNVTNGKRFITYAISNKEDEIIIMGAAAKLCDVDDSLIILSYMLLDSEDLYSYSKNYPKIVRNGRYVG